MNVVEAIIELFKPYYHYFFIAILILGAIGILLSLIFKKQK